MQENLIMGVEFSGSRSTFMRFLAYLVQVSAIFCTVAHAAEWRLHVEWDREGSVRFQNEKDQVVAGPGPIVSWQNFTPKILHQGADAATLALTSDCLTAEVTNGSSGQFGELVFTVDVQNRGRQSVTGALLP